jgi:molybdopterin-guanine dinucleotide biosynthesis protein B
MPFFLSICGNRKSGKTTFILSLAEQILKNGFSVGIVKSSSHKEVLTDTPGKDTWKFRELGISYTALLQKNILTLYVNLSSLTENEVFHLLNSIFWKEDVVLVEGLKELDRIKKLWVLKDENPEEVKLKNLEGFLTDQKEKYQSLYPDKKFFSLKVPEEVFNWIKQEIKKEEILLFVNGKRIYLNEFVEKIIKEPLLAVLKVLKGVPEDIFHVELKLRR